MSITKKFAADWAKTKISILIHYFPNYEGPWQEHSELVLAGTIAQFSFLITDQVLSEKVFQFSKQMAGSALKGITEAWDETDDICPPPYPHWWWIRENFEPEPSPWKEINAAEQVEIAYLFTKFSSLTTNSEFNRALKSFATQIVRGVADRITDEFEKCETLPRRKRAFGNVNEI